MHSLDSYLFISAMLFCMNLVGHIFGLFVIVLAAAEAAVALAIIINIYNNLNSINVDDAAELRQ